MIVKAPSVLSFSENAAETLRFLAELREAALDQKKVKHRGKWSWSRLRADLSTIQTISLPAAIVLSAEFQRWSLLRGVQLQPWRLKHWTPRVKHLLAALGTFQLLNIRARKAGAELSADALAIFPLQSGVRSEQEKVAQLQDDLHSLGVVFEQKTYIFDGLSEAVFNAIDHAYPPEQDASVKKVTVGHRWWATSCYDPNTENLRFFVYDQGVGIPKTLQEKKEWTSAIKRLTAMIKGDAASDAEMIKAAFEIGRTRTKLQQRGKGLDQMASVVRLANGGYMRVLSGRGDVQTDGHGKYDTRMLPSEALGTLIEWGIPLELLSKGED